MPFLRALVGSMSSTVGTTRANGGAMGGSRRSTSVESASATRVERQPALRELWSGRAWWMEYLLGRRGAETSSESELSRPPIEGNLARLWPGKLPTGRKGRRSRCGLGMGACQQVAMAGGSMRRERNRWDPRIGDQKKRCCCTQMTFRGIKFLTDPLNTLLEGVV
jgi:hypothetical protein